jgi:uncharacterized protein (TIGR03083 family)
MQLTPRYDEPDSPDLFRWELPFGDPSVPLLRQRSRFADVLAGLDDDQWAVPSRCEGWSVQDVVAHLNSTNQFWAVSIASGRRGAPTRFLETFDPVAGPASMVDAVRSQSFDETLNRFIETNAALTDTVSDLDDDAWSTIAEAPPGHIPIGAVALHALWDSWVHERDVVLPLGMAPAEEADEIDGSLTYVAALGPAFLACAGSTRRGTIEIVATQPDVRLVLELGDSVVVRAGPAPAGGLRVAGTAVELVEALSFRAPFPFDVSEADGWMLDGLAEVFEVAG